MSTKLMALTGAAVMLMTGLVLADPLPGQFPKFEQVPMVATPISDSTGIVNTYFGHDEASQANYVGNVNEWELYTGTSWMADDFADPFDTPVVHVQWWGSYIDVQPIEPELGHIKKFLIEFLSDQPGDAAAPSRPLDLLQHEVVTKVPAGASPLPQSGTFTEKLVRDPDPLLGENLYMYNAELKLPFKQEPDTVYWLKIVALEDDPVENLLWGWHNRDYTIMDPWASVPPAVMPGEHVAGVLPDGMQVWHFQDDAVQGTNIRYSFNPDTGEWLIEEDWPDALPQLYLPPYDGPEEIGQYSKDLAFVLYTVPEPATMGLLVLGGVGMLVLRRRRRRG